MVVLLIVYFLISTSHYLLRYQLLLEPRLVLHYNYDPSHERTVGFGIEHQPIVKDSIFVSALLSYDASITVQIGGNSYTPDWDVIPFNHQGMFFASVPFGGSTGDVQVCLTRIGADILCIKSDPSE